MQDIAEAIRLLAKVEDLAIATVRNERLVDQLKSAIKEAFKSTQLDDPDGLQSGPEGKCVSDWANRVEKFARRGQERLQQGLNGKRFAKATRSLARIPALTTESKRIANAAARVANSAQSAATSLQKLTTKGKQLRPAEEVVQSQKPSLQNFGNGPNAHARDAQKIAKRALREISEQADAIFKKVKESSRFEATKLRDEIEDFVRTGDASRQTKESALEKLRELSKLAS